MNNFIVSARKYRPATFKSVIGQVSITATLKNAIKNNHLAHAYLFCGPRGVGKTTCARIFAKTINCQNITDDFEPCNTCESCHSFNKSRSYNIHELDAASNNSVEDIRNLIEQVRIPPQFGKYSVYIIDEVHMLSSQAFNAFLKTLEEPPPHAIFILATTEKHKILPTILSRCQIFDFNRIKVEDITKHLQYVADQEVIKAEHDALNIIAQKSDGAMRDALSYFDQIVSFSGNNISYQDVIDNLNVLDYDYYFKLTQAILEGDFSLALMIFNEILEKGFDGHHFINGLSKHFRDIMVCKDPQTIELLEVGAGIKEKYLNQAKKVSLSFLLKALNITNACDLSYKLSQEKRLHVELAIFNLSAISQELDSLNINQNKIIQQNPVKEKETEVKNRKENILKEDENSYSIKNVLKGKSEKQKEIKNSESKIEQKVEQNMNFDFDNKKLEQVWNSFAQSIKKEKPRLFSILNSNKPAKNSNNLIKFTVGNVLQEKAVNNIKSLLLLEIGKLLNNNNISLNVIVDEKKEKQGLYTDSDKYKYLNTKNENLNKLKQQFNLDF